MEHLPLAATLAEYEAQAEQLLQGHAQGDANALELIHKHHPRFLDQKIKWLPLQLSHEDLKKAPFDSNDARLAIARW